jgi:hypothetical protein
VGIRLGAERYGRAGARLNGHKTLWPGVLSQKPRPSLSWTRPDPPNTVSTRTPSVCGPRKPPSRRTWSGPS